LIEKGKREKVKKERGVKVKDSRMDPVRRRRRREKTR